MWKGALILAICCALCSPVVAEEFDSERLFSLLDPHGDWVKSPEWGWLWKPRGTAAEWRPYSIGSWAWTDAGWTWISYEPFGWITFHYGRWIHAAHVGWVWMPGAEWAPAWVCWRSSDGYIGWAPLPMTAELKQGATIAGWVDLRWDMGPNAYNFVDARNFGELRLPSFVLPLGQNPGLMRETRNVTNLFYNKDLPFIGGPEFATATRASYQPLRKLTLEFVDAASRERGGNAASFRETVEGNTLRVCAPRWSLNPSAKPPNVAVQLQRTDVDKGWSGVANAPALRAELQAQGPKAP